MLTICEDRTEKEVVKEFLFDHQGHIKSLSGKLHFNRIQKNILDNKIRHKVSL